MIVLTGGAGFIGSCILAELNARGKSDILVVDHLNHKLKEENLKGKKFSQYLEKEDFLKLILENRVSAPVDQVIHMGACSSTTLQDKEYYHQNNFEYSRQLAQWCLRHRTRLIYASSAATYGDGSQGYRDDEATMRRCRPLNFYGESKHRFDVWALEEGFLDRMVGLKFFNVFGPNEYHKGDMRSVVAKSYEGVMREGKIRLFKSYREEFADGEQKRDFIYVKDAVDIVMFFLEHTAVQGIYNVGSGQAQSWNDLAFALFQAVGKKPNIEYFDMPLEMRDRYQYFTEAEMSKLRQVGYRKAFTPLAEAIKDYSQYLKRQQHI